MKYYKVREMYDQFPKHPQVRDGNIFIGGELYTEKELNNLPYMYAGIFEQIDVPKTKTFWSFGARFESEVG